MDVRESMTRSWLLFKKLSLQGKSMFLFLTVNSCFFFLKMVPNLLVVSYRRKINRVSKKANNMPEMASMLLPLLGL